jgi:hypothetical protein
MSSILRFLIFRAKNSGWAVTVEEQPESSYWIVLKK